MMIPQSVALFPSQTSNTALGDRWQPSYGGGRTQAPEESIWESVLPGLWNARVVVPPRGAEAYLYVSLIMFGCIPRIVAMYI